MTHTMMKHPGDCDGDERDVLFIIFACFSSFATKRIGTTGRLDFGRK